MAAMRTMALALTLALIALARSGPALAKKTPPPPPPPPAAAPAPPTIKTGVEKWRAGDYAAAVAIWTPFADQGDPDALFNLGQAYKLGRGVEANAATARDYYRKAATKGHLPAQANLGIALFQAGEKPEAIKWLKTAADRGEARAQYVLGIAAFNGDGLPRSGSLGYAYLLRAQASGLPQAQAALTTIVPGLSPVDRSAGEAAAASLAAGTGVPPGLAAVTGPRLIPATPSARASLPIVTPPPGAGGGAGSTAGSVAGGGSTPGAGQPAPTRTAAAPTGTAAMGPASAPRTASVTGSLPAAGAPPGSARTAAAGAPASAFAPRSAASAAAPTDAAAMPTAATRTTSAPGGAAPPSAAGTAAATLPPVPKPVPATPLRQPTPAQADAAAAAAARTPPARVAASIPPGSQSGAPQALREPPPARADAAAGLRPTVATVDVPPSRLTAPDPLQPATDPDPRARRAAASGTARGEPPYPGSTAAQSTAAQSTAAQSTSAGGGAASATGRAGPVARPSKPFEVAAEAPHRPDGWRVQLGAFSSRKLADAAWAGARDAAAPAKPVFATDGTVTKLQIGPYATRDAAKAACTRLTAAGRACFVTQG